VIFTCDLICDLPITALSVPYKSYWEGLNFPLAPSNPLGAFTPTSATTGRLNRCVLWQQHTVATACRPLASH